MKHLWALVPLKDLAGAKTRLAGALGVRARGDLALAMARDVVAALAHTPAIERIVLVSDIADLERRIGVPGIVCHRNPGPRGLNEDLAAAALWAAGQGATDVLIAHADLPMLTATALERFIADPPAASGGLRAAGCKLGTGTNLLLAPLPLPLPLVFGRDSLARFRATAAAAGIPFEVRNDPALAADIDEFEDYLALETLCADGGLVTGATAMLLREKLVPAS